MFVTSKITRKMTMNKDNSFGKKLKQIRLARGFSQAKLAEMADVHEKHISKIETGRFHPNFDTLNKILKALNITLDSIDTELQKISTTDNQFYLKSIQILNNADSKDLEFYYSLLKTTQKNLAILKNSQR